MYDYVSSLLQIPSGSEYEVEIIAITTALLLLFFCRVIFKFIYKLLEH